MSVRSYRMGSMKKRVLFGARILEKRTREGLSQREVAEILGIASNTVARWERDEMEPQGLYRMVLLKWLDSRPRKSKEGETT